MKPDVVEKRGGAFHIVPDPAKTAGDEARKSHAADLAALEKPLTIEELQPILLRALTRLAALEEPHD
jgi:hypothetical protein